MTWWTKEVETFLGKSAAWTINDYWCWEWSKVVRLVEYWQKDGPMASQIRAAVDSQRLCDLWLTETTSEESAAILAHIS